mmetsp:Transcript_27700/g.55367  ORF Transcript_27700/g.55367 Transcript_27700/m.55367 type:complete len:273 (+) Transcript_27700:53-871(+)
MTRNENTRKAYDQKDIEMSIAARNADKMKLTEEATEVHAGGSNELVKPLIFGGLDGIITTFAIVAAVNGAGMSTDTIILMGVANLVADAISMGLGDYISSKAEADAVQKEYDREKWELENYPEGEYKEVIEIYETKHGVSNADATQLVGIFKRYPKLFLDTMFVEELEMMPPEGTEDLWKEALVTFLAFVVFGSVPLLAYVIALLAGADSGNDELLFAISCVATAMTMFALGVTKAKFTKSDPIKSGASMLLNGGLAATAAWSIGFTLEELL